MTANLSVEKSADTAKRPALTLRTGRWERLLTRVSIIGIGVLVAWSTLMVLGLVPPASGWDERTYREATLRWIAGGPWYLPHQLAGPYIATGGPGGDVLYPPVALWLFVPLSLLPPQVWYAAPIAMVAWSLYRLRPAWWAWTVLFGLCAAWGFSLGYWVLGNPKTWLVALLLVMLAARPSRRGWVAAGIVLAGLSLPFLPMWPDFFAAAANARGMDYQRSTFILFLIPLIAWLGRERARPS